MGGGNARAQARKGVGGIEQAFHPAQLLVIELPQQVLQASMSAQSFMMGCDKVASGRGRFIRAPWVYQ
ncbi:hypothetical protein D3C78_1775420 [compost metagenome]